jgi:sugar phosphate isomerase/epimerase
MRPRNELLDPRPDPLAEHRPHRSPGSGSWIRGLHRGVRPAASYRLVAEAVAAAPDMALLVDVAEKLRSPQVVFTGGRPNEGGLEATTAGLEALLPLIAGRPVRLAVEPHRRSQIETRQDFDAIFRRIKSPQVGITVDCGRFHSVGIDWAALICDYPDRIYNVHLKHHVGEQSVPIGEGEIDIRRLIERLHQIGYRGALAVELEVVDLENLPRYCAEAYGYLHALVDEVTGQPPA